MAIPRTIEAIFGTSSDPGKYQCVLFIQESRLNESLKTVIIHATISLTPVCTSLHFSHLPFPDQHILAQPQRYLVDDTFAIPVYNFAHREILPLSPIFPSQPQTGKERSSGIIRILGKPFSAPCWTLLFLLWFQFSEGFLTSAIPCGS